MSHNNSNPGNPYAPAADGLLHQSEMEAHPPHAMLSATQAVAQATLNLAYEQRTANLIALFTQENLDVNYGYLLKQITERMGLAETAKAAELAEATAATAEVKDGAFK